MQHLLHMNVEMKCDVILPCLYLLLSPAMTAWDWSGLLIVSSIMLTMCLASSSVALQ